MLRKKSPFLILSWFPFFGAVVALLNGTPLTLKLMWLFSSQWCASHLKTHEVVLFKKKKKNPPSPFFNHPQSFLRPRPNLSTCWKWKNRQQSPLSYFWITFNLFLSSIKPPLNGAFLFFFLLSLNLFLDQRDSSLPKKKTSQPSYLPFQKIGSLSSTCYPIHLSKTICSLSTTQHFFFFPYVPKISFPKPCVLSPQLSISSCWLYRHGKTTHQPKHDPLFRIYTCWIFFFKGPCIPSRVNSRLGALMQNKKLKRKKENKIRRLKINKTKEDERNKIIRLKIS